MIKDSQLEEAQFLLQQRKAIKSRLKLMNDRNNGWPESLLVTISGDAILGNRQYQNDENFIDSSPGFHEAASKISLLIEQYLMAEIASIEDQLTRLGIEIEG